MANTILSLYEFSDYLEKLWDKCIFDAGIDMALEAMNSDCDLPLSYSNNQ